MKAICQLVISFLFFAILSCHDTYSFNSLSGTYSGICYHEKTRLENGKYVTTYDTSYHEIVKVEIIEEKVDGDKIEVEGNCFYPSVFFINQDNLSNDTLIFSQFISYHQATITIFVNSDKMETDYLAYQASGPGWDKNRGYYEKK